MRVVIVGGGFGGVKTALELSKRPEIDVTLVSERDHFLYYPALYGAATGQSHLQSVVPLSEIFEGKRVKVVHATMTGIDSHRKLIATTAGDINYDTAVLALGVVTTYFGIKGLDTYSFSIKTFEELTRFKTHLHNELSEDKHLDKNYVIVGAGATGVELSAALGTYLKRISKVHSVRRTKLNIRLVEAAPRVLPRMSERASAKVQARLINLGVQVQTNKLVKEQDDDSIIIGRADVPTQTVVWTSGVANHPFFADHDFTLAPNGRVAVNEYLQAQPDVYVIGDNANTTYTGLAQTALHDALFVTKHITATLQHKKIPVYKTIKPPVVIPVGENWAVLEWGPVLITGYIAALVRRLSDLIGYHDVLPIGQAIGVWHAQTVREEECDICKIN